MSANIGVNERAAGPGVGRLPVHVFIRLRTEGMGARGQEREGREDDEDNASDGGDGCIPPGEAKGGTCIEGGRHGTGKRFVPLLRLGARMKPLTIGLSLFFLSFLSLLFIT